MGGQFFHGLLMWISWSFMGFLQLVSARYLKQFYSWYKTMHAIVGICIMVTIWISFVVILDN